MTAISIALAAEIWPVLILPIARGVRPASGQGGQQESTTQRGPINSRKGHRCMLDPLINRFDEGCHVCARQSLGKGEEMT